jgi:hypothetical protein
MLGYRGHFSTKSRRYSTTLGALRQTRAGHRADQARQILGLPASDERNTITITVDRPIRNFWEITGLASLWASRTRASTSAAAGAAQTTT